MPVLPIDTIRRLLQPYVTVELPAPLLNQVSEYLDLLVRWNARISLTAIRDPEEMVQRHFGESFFTAEKLSKHLKNDSKLLDFGSGPGFPGLPIQMFLPEIHVTLAESQARKVAFLREITRTLGLSAEIWPKRVEEMPENHQFDAITLRAVEKMAISLETAATRLNPRGGYIAALVGRDIFPENAPISNQNRTILDNFAIPESNHRRLVIWQIVPRGTIG